MAAADVCPVSWPGHFSVSVTFSWVTKDCNAEGNLALAGQVLVELATEREQDIPALIYEGRSTAVCPLLPSLLLPRRCCQSVQN